MRSSDFTRGPLTRPLLGTASVSHRPVSPRSEATKLPFGTLGKSSRLPPNGYIAEWAPLSLVSGYVKDRVHLGRCHGDPPMRVSFAVRDVAAQRAPEPWCRTWGLVDLRRL